jgi:hypothetical protein
MTNKQMRMLVPIIAVALLLLVIGGFVAFFALGSYLEGGTGSMAEARRLRPLVEAMPQPTTSAADYKTGTVAVVYPSGEWVVGVAKDSHGLYTRLTGGGTVVLKDSRGRVRCFFGHLCGGGRIGQEAVPKIDSLDTLDVYLAKKFAEGVWP